MRGDSGPRSRRELMSSMLLTVNAGSSSVKFSVFGIVSGGGLELRCRGRLDGIGTRPRLRVRDDGEGVLIDETYEPGVIADVPAATTRVATWLRQQLGRPPEAVGHRLAVGGPRYAAPIVVDDRVIADLEVLVPLAPLHQPHNIAPMRALRARDPGLLQIACFDSGFHHGHPEVADRFAIPDALHQEGVRRYGFHGLSYEYIAGALPTVAPELASARVVVAHLGSGASMCAMRGRRSIDTTMSFTGLDGLPMGTRCGQIDPGVLLYLLTEKRYDVRTLEHMLYHESGLRGLSGISNDVRDLLASADPKARLALDCFVYRATRELGALAAALGGLDALVFTAGIGENSPEIRARICRDAAWLGLRVDDAANQANARRISTAESAVSAWVIPTDEERMIAEHSVRIWAASRAA
jgi:acetate kinase